MGWSWAAVCGVHGWGHIAWLSAQLVKNGIASVLHTNPICGMIAEPFCFTAASDGGDGVNDNCNSNVKAISI